MNEVLIDMKYNLLCVGILLLMNELSAQVVYPETKKIHHQDMYFGHVVDDPYQWLEDDNSEETHAWVIQENKVTQKYLSQIKYRDQLKSRLTELYNYVKTTDFFKAGDLIIYKKNDGLQNQALWMYKKGMDGEEKVLIDPNKEDPAGTTTFSFLDYNKKRNLISVELHKAGSDWMEIKALDLNTFQFLKDELKWIKFSDTQWYGDGFYYSKYPTPESGKEFSAATENQCIYYHQLGTDQNEDVLIYTDPEAPRHYHHVRNTDDNKYQILYKYRGSDGFELLYRKLPENPKEVTPFVYLFKGFESKNEVLGHVDGHFIIKTDVEAPNYKIISIDLQHPEKENWKTIVPESSSVIEYSAIAGNKIVAGYLKNACSELKVFDLNGQNAKDIQLPGLGTAELSYSKASDDELIYHFTSFTQPNTSYSYNLKTGATAQLAHPELGFSTSDFVTRQIWYTSKDGTKVPMFLIYKKGMKQNGKNPAYLYGYGGFGVNITPAYSSSYISLLEQGTVIAIANLRGGGEFGEEWHRAGMLMKKQNVFDDFIAAAEYLITEKYTSSSKLALAGGSNGGLLVGACMIQRPELFRVAFPAVGVMDMLKYQNFTVGWGWVSEYGASNQSEEMFKYLYGYSPYHNLRKGVNYPATMVTTADHDDRVVPAHSFKFAARLQEYTMNKFPALIRIDVQAGHGKGKPVSKIIDEISDKWSFFLWNTGVKKLKKIK